MTQHATSHQLSSVTRPGALALPQPREGVDELDCPTWGWALVEIRSDGTWGEPLVVPAPGTVEPLGARAAAAVPCSIKELSELLKTHLTVKDVGNASRHGVAAMLLHVAGAAPAETRGTYLGPLAHVEALQGDLRRAERHARQVLSGGVDRQDGSGLRHALLAQAWVAFERADFDGAQRDLSAGDDEPAWEQDAWLATSHLLLDAKLKIATGVPEAATRLLATRSASAQPGPTDWLSELVTVVWAEALIASGEPERAMTILTPVPKHAAVEAMVVAACARRSIGDVRGASAVLSRAVADLDHAPLALQVEAWLLEARMAEDQERPDRARLLMNRALRSATAEGMRRPVLRDWPWVRRFVEREPDLLRLHRGFLASFRGDDVPPSRSAAGGRRAAHEPAGPARPSPLTEREAQVLELLAEMYSTDEIAEALYVSANTVKTHLKGIFGKLGVNRRVEAVRRGRMLGLC